MVNVGEVKRLVNSSKNFVILMIMPKSNVNHEPFEDFYPKLKSDLYDVVDAHHDMFSGANMIASKKGDST